MATYIALANFTDQGVRTIKESTKRADAVKALGTKFGVNMTNIFWTLGKYDLVTICEAESDAAIAAFGLAIGAAGNVRLQTLRAFTKGEMDGIISKLG